MCRIIYKKKEDLEIYGTIEGGLAIYHGHGTILSASSIGSDFSVYQGVTLGKKKIDGRERLTPIIGNNVTVYTNAIVVGGITVGDNVVIGAGCLVMCDIPNNSLVVGNPCKIIPLSKKESVEQRITV